MRAIASLSLIPLLLGGCATIGPQATGVVAPLMLADGRQAGTVRLVDSADGVRIVIAASGMVAGPLGVHLHAIGKCEGPSFTSAGAHWNPAGKQHGHLNPEGPHGGDLGNLVVEPDGAVQVTLNASMARLRDGAAPLIDADGAALVIHARSDDERTDPSGNSGDRIACAAFG